VSYNDVEKVDILDRKDFDQDLISSIESAMAFMKRHLNVASEIKTLQRTEKLELPEVALREALVNAVAHRNYLEMGARVMVEVFSDRVVISSPGGLPKGMPWKDFGKYSLARNPLLADLFLRVKLIEKLGTGVNRIKAALKADHLPEASFHADGFFAVTMVRSGGPIEDGEGLTTGGAMGGTMSGPIGGPMQEEEVTEKQGEVLQLISEQPQLSRRKMAEFLNINVSAVQKHIEKLKEKGVLKRIGGTRGHWKVKQ